MEQITKRKSNISTSLIIIMPQNSLEICFSNYISSKHKCVLLGQRKGEWMSSASDEMVRMAAAPQPHCLDKGWFANIIASWRNVVWWPSLSFSCDLRHFATIPLFCQISQFTTLGRQMPLFVFWRTQLNINLTTWGHIRQKSSPWENVEKGHHLVTFFSSS